MLIRAHLSRDPRVNRALAVMEKDLRPALVAATQQMNDLLLTRPDDAMYVHSALSDLHQVIAQIDRNLQRYADSTA